MSGHVSEDMLIQCLFDLASDAQQQAVQAHLETCEACRAMRDRLEAKFRSLDELDEPVEVSPTLVSKAVAQSKRRRHFGARAAWLSAAAAVLVIGSLALVEHMGRRRGGSEPSHFASAPSPAPGKTPQLGMGLTNGTSSAISIGEKPPFAPASAIELNVLPRRDDLQLTIYNAADLTLVRETRKLTFKRGWNWLQLMWANTLIDPTSLSLEPLENADKIEVQQLVYPPRLKDLGRWLVRSEISGQVPVRITYLTSGLSWRAFYTGTLTPDEKEMHLAGYVRVDNRSGEDYEKAQVRLVVGRVHLLDQIADLARRPQPYGSPVPIPSRDKRSAGRSYYWYEGDQDVTDFALLPGMGGMGGFGGRLGMEGLPEKKEITKEGLSEYFLYTIEGTETIPNEWGKRLPSFEADAIPVENLYKYDEKRWGSEVIRFLSFVNDAEHELGQTPLPDGNVAVYRDTGENQHLAYIGAMPVKYIPVGEKTELNLGAARQVKIEPVLMDSKTDHYEFDDEQSITGWDEIETWRVTVTNARPLPVKIEVYRHFGTAYWTIKNRGQYGDYEPDDASTAKYVLQVEPRSKCEFEYVLTIYHGTRQESRR